MDPPVSVPRPKTAKLALTAVAGIAAGAVADWRLSPEDP